MADEPMKKPKIEYGQCYEYQDHVYMVKSGPWLSEYYQMQDTLSKEYDFWTPDFILTLRRPFNNND
jgi:uncharacterized protein affecting Mg2+/Co2+ transport